jgi:hypothetical protein
MKNFVDRLTLTIVHGIEKTEEREQLSIVKALGTLGWCELAKVEK